MISAEQLSFMVSLKIPYIVMNITDKLRVTSDVAFELLYSSVTYKLLSDERTYYWGESAQFVTESFIREYNGLPIEEF